MHSDFQTYRFVMIVSIVAAFLLSLTAESLKEKQNYNIEIDRKKNVLKCAGIEVSSVIADGINNKYNKLIIEKVISKEGDYVDILISDLENTENKSTGQINYLHKNIEYLPIYEYHVDNVIKAYIFPISGKGLWSTLHGYFSLEKDMNTVNGITFYKHKETPGLGAEVEKKWFQNNFLNKTIFNESDDLVSITVSKGKASPKGIKHKVDGISGATITGSGLTTFLKADLKRYLPFIKNKKIKEINNMEIGV